ncbi:hypothetical protein TNCV_5092071 [Trichonephila clavipes]|nr:hypothetical protein TNCV_5092071 [Trichonephila clavipes]
MVSPAVQGQVPHPSIVPEFLRSTSCGMTSARGHGAIVYCLNSGSEERQTGRHNMLCEGETRNRWRDGQVCPDVDKELWRLGPDVSGVRRGEDGERRKEKGEETEGEERGDGKGEEKESGRERGARLVWRKGLSPEIGVEKTMNAGGVENRID